MSVIVVVIVVVIILVVVVVMIIKATVEMMATMIPIRLKEDIVIGQLAFDFFLFSYTVSAHFRRHECGRHESPKAMNAVQKGRVLLCALTPTD